MNDHSAALLRLSDALTLGDRDAVIECFAEDASLDLMSDEKLITVTNAGISDAVDTLFAGFDNIKLTPISRELTPSKIVQESVISGDHRGSFAGEQPTSSRVRVNVKLSATAAADSNLQPLLQSLSVEADTRALFAQIAGTDDVVGVTGGLIAAARERHEGGVRIIQATRPRAAAVAIRRAQGRTSESRRRWAVLVGAALVMGAAVLLAIAYAFWPESTDPAIDAGAQQPVGAKSPPGHPTATSSQQARATKTVNPTALPVIKIAAPKSVPHVQPGRQVVLNSDVLFGFDSAALTPAARTALTRVASQVRSARVTGTIQVNGYTDNLGSVGYDLALSRARALAVAGVLQKGLVGQAVTLAPQGFGRTNPVSSNTSGAGRARNRRVTIVLPTPR